MSTTRKLKNSIRQLTSVLNHCKEVLSEEKGTLPSMKNLSDDSLIVMLEGLLRTIDHIYLPDVIKVKGRDPTLNDFLVHYRKVHKEVQYYLK